MLNINAEEQLSLFDLKSKLQSKELGQFFTESKTADYMASMLHAIGNVELVKILDAGAGDGILTASAARRCLELGNRRVHAVLFELDKDILSTLEVNMDRLVRIFIKKGGEFSYEILNEDFVLSRPNKHERSFHISIINPPYFKYHLKGVRPLLRTFSEVPNRKGDATLFKQATKTENCLLVFDAICCSLFSGCACHRVFH